MFNSIIKKILCLIIIGIFTQNVYAEKISEDNKYIEDNYNSNTLPRNRHDALVDFNKPFKDNKSVSGKIQFSIDEKQIDISPRLVNSYMMLPVRDVFEIFNYDVALKGKTIEIKYGSTKGVLSLGSDKIILYKDGMSKSITLCTHVELLDGVTYAPLQTFAEIMDVSIELAWSQIGKSAYVDVYNTIVFDSPEIEKLVVKELKYLWNKYNPKTFDLETCFDNGVQINEFAWMDMYLGRQGTLEKNLEMCNRYYGKMNEILKDIIHSNMSEFDKVKAIHDYIASNIIYNHNYDDLTLEDYSAYGVLLNNIGVCNGYSELMMEMLMQVDVECKLITGTEKMNHKWNVVKIDGNWYQMDVTLDAATQLGREISYAYFLKSDDTMSLDHEWLEITDQMYALPNIKPKCPNDYQWEGV